MIYKITRKRSKTLNFSRINRLKAYKIAVFKAFFVEKSKKTLIF